MTIREGRLNDIPKLLEIGQYYLDQIHPGMTIDKNSAPKDLRYLMSSKTGVVLVAEHHNEIVGVLVGQVMKQAFVNCRYATDLAFVVMPGHPIQAVQLARQFVHWAKGMRNVKEIVLNISSGLGNVERVGEMYERLGMRKMGGTYAIYLD